MPSHAERPLSELGEKWAISNIIKPLLNPTADVNSVGDDCAVINVGNGRVICASTDRVPADLIAYRLGIIDLRGLGFYLAVLNLSDIAAMGAIPAGILLNLGLPHDIRIGDLDKILRGARDACELYNTAIVGGDLSSAYELSLSATSLGVASEGELLRRFGMAPGDAVYCTAQLGLTAAAFAYFLRCVPKGIALDAESEELLKDQFRRPVARFDQARRLVEEKLRVTAMDNTDGAGQTLSELADLNSVAIVLHPASLPIHPLTREVASLLGEDPIEFALSAGADFQLLGSIDGRAEPNVVGARCGAFIIGEVSLGTGIWQKTESGATKALRVVGWDYYSDIGEKLSKLSHANVK